MTRHPWGECPTKASMHHPYVSHASISCSLARDVCFIPACLNAVIVTLFGACAASLAVWAVLLRDAVDGMRHSRGLIRCGKGCQAGADLAEHSSTWRCSRCSCCASPPASFSLEASFLFSSASCFFSPFCLTSAACSAPCASVCARAQTVPTRAVSKASLRNFLSFR